MRADVLLFALLAIGCMSYATNQKPKSDFFNPIPKPDPPAPPRMPYLSRANNWEVWRIQNQVIRQGLDDTPVIFAGHLFHVKKVGGLYVARMNEFESLPSENAFVNLATKLINTGVIAASRVGGETENVVLPNYDSKKRPVVETDWKMTNASSSLGQHGILHSFLTTRHVAGQPDIPPTPERFGISFSDEFLSALRNASSSTRVVVDAVVSDHAALGAFKSIRVVANSGKLEVAFTLDSAQGNVVSGLNTTDTTKCNAAPGDLPAADYQKDICNEWMGQRWNSGSTAKRRLDLTTYDSGYAQLRVFLPDSLSLVNHDFLASCSKLPQVNLGTATHPTRWCIKYDSLAMQSSIFFERYLESPPLP